MTKIDATFSNFELIDSRESDCSMDWQVTFILERRGKRYDVTVWSAEGSEPYLMARNVNGKRAPFHKKTQAALIARARQWARV